MQIQIVSKNIDVSAALRERVTDRLEDMMDKYIHRDGEALVSVMREGQGFRTIASVHLPSGATLQGQGDADDAYGAADESLEHLEKRLRRYKRKLKDHHADKRAHEALAMQVLKNPVADQDEDDDTDVPQEPLVIADSQTKVQTMSVSRASLELGLTDNGAVVFYNARHGGLNVVFKRADGNIGWIDPKPQSS